MNVKALYTLCALFLSVLFAPCALAQGTNNGEVVCNAPGDQYLALSCADNAGGAFIFWYDGRSGVDYVKSQEVVHRVS
jgi:hypothetical protein